MILGVFFVVVVAVFHLYTQIKSMKKNNEKKNSIVPRNMLVYSIEIIENEKNERKQFK